MLVIFILVAFIGTFGYNFNVVVPLIAEFVLKVGPGQFGLLTSALGAGSLVSALAVASAGRQRPSRLLMWAGAFSVLVISLAVVHSYWIDIVVLALLGLTGVALMTGAGQDLLSDPRVRAAYLGE